MGLFDKHSIVSDSLRHAASKTAAMIENAFNTKVLVHDKKLYSDIII